MDSLFYVPRLSEKILWRKDENGQSVCKACPADTITLGVGSLLAGLSCWHKMFQSLGRWDRFLSVILATFFWGQNPSKDFHLLGEVLGEALASKRPKR